MSYIHYSATYKDWNEGSVMFDQNLELNDTWHEMARDSPKNDSAGILLEKHLVWLLSFSPPLTIPLTAGNLSQGG